jgi:hypothetical protein
MRTWMLHHNTPCHTAVSINEFLAEIKHSSGSSVPLFAVTQTLYVILFPMLKNNLEGRHFGTFDNIQKA